MRISAPSLARHLDRGRTLELLGITLARPPVLPHITRCPLCREEHLLLLRDTHNQADWASCLHCGFSGDLIEFAARIWSMGVAQTCERLAKEGAMSQEDLVHVESYVDQHIQHRCAVMQFWATAQEAFQTPDLQDVRGPLARLGPGLLEGQRLIKVRRWLGVATKESLEELYHPLSYATVIKMTTGGSPRSRRQSGPGASRLFKGLGWEKVLLLAACDLPGRICGFLMIGRDGDPAKGDIIFRTAPSMPPRSGTSESGVLLSDCFFQFPDKLSAKRWPGIRFIGLDYLSVLKLQLHHVSLGNRPFPLATTFQDDRHGPVHCWDAAPRGSLLFFSEEDPQRAVTTASTVGGQVGQTGSRCEVCRDQTYLFHIYRQRKRGLVAIAEDLARMPFQQAVQRYHALPISVTQRRQLLSELSPEIADFITENGVRQSVQVMGHVIEQCADGLVDRTTGRHLVNALIRIHEICGDRSKGQILFGTVRIQGEETVFALPQAEVAESSFLAALQVSLHRRSRAPLIYHKRAHELIWSAILAFHKPVVSQGRVSVGWCAEAEQFRFPRFQVSSGEIREGSPLEGLERPTPCRDWRADRTPESLNIALHDLEEDAQCVFWALFAVVVQQLIASKVGWPKRGLIIHGAAAQDLVLGMARGFGLLCPSYPDYQSTDDQVDWLERQSREHDVPCLLDLRGGRGRDGIRRWVQGIGDKPGLLLLPEELGVTLTQQKRFDSFDLPQRNGPARNWRCPNLPSELVAHYLADLLERNFVLSTRESRPIVRVLDDIQRWATGRGISFGARLRFASFGLTSAADIVAVTNNSRAVELATADSPEVKLHGPPTDGCHVASFDAAKSRVCAQSGRKLLSRDRRLNVSGSEYDPGI